MRRYIRHVGNNVFRGLAATGAAIGLFATFGSGTAAALNEYKGMTFADAANAISSSGGSYYISTRVGTFLPDPQCKVSGSHTASFIQANSNSSRTVTYLDLNCNYYFSLPGVPGYSRASEDGKAAYDDAVQKQKDAQAQAQAEAEAAAAAEGGAVGVEGGE